MNVRIFIFIALLFSVNLQAEEEKEEVTAKVVYHCDFNDDKRFSLMLDNIRNSVVYYNDEMMEYDIRVVANAACVRYFFSKMSIKNLSLPNKDLKNKIQNRVSHYDIGFYVCEKTMNAYKLKKKNLEKYMQVVTSGVVEIIRLQQEENFGYLKVQ